MHALHTGEAGAIFAGRFYGSHIKPGTKDLGIQYSENFTELSINPLKTNMSTDRCNKLTLF